MARRPKLPDDAEELKRLRLRAARELVPRLQNYIKHDAPLGSEVTLAVEDTLDAYLELHRLERDQQSVDYMLASAAVQILHRIWRDSSGKERDRLLLKAVRTISRIRREKRPGDMRPESENDVVSRIKTALHPRRTRQPDDATLENRVFEILAEGIHEPDTRRGVRKARRQLLDEAGAIWRNPKDAVWVTPKKRDLSS
ncbi:MAG TPA: hypothetical protein VGJ84_10155 [Polyangiaceae bacterium]